MSGKKSTKKTQPKVEKKAPAKPQVPEWARRPLEAKVYTHPERVAAKEAKRLAEEYGFHVEDQIGDRYVMAADAPAYRRYKGDPNA